jgi:hypothetical protein
LPNVCASGDSFAIVFRRSRSTYVGIILARSANES